MKKTKLFALAFAALALGACSSDDVVEQKSQAQWTPEGQGYINLAINLPTQAGSRANDNFDDGTIEEYNVKDATLILFADDKVNSAYNLDINFPPADGTVDNITTTAKITRQINAIASTDIKALVVLNNNEMFTVSDDGDLKVDGTTMVGKTLAELNTAVNAQIGNKTWTEDGFLMSNAVLANAQGGTVAPTNAEASILVPIATDKIYDNYNEASLNPAASIYVERAVSKVTLTAADGNTTEGTALPYTVSGWTLDNTNNSSNLVREVTNFDTWKAYTSSAQAAGVDKYRFVGNAAVGTNIDGDETYYRVYWGEDRNYTDAPEGSFTTVGGETVADAALNTNVDGTVARYCFENTSDLDHMVEQNMTRVIVKATFNGGDDFYIVDNDKDELWPLEDVKQEVAARLINEPGFNAWAKTHIVGTLNESDLNVTLSTAAGVCTVTAVTLAEDADVKFAEGTTSLPDNVAETANSRIDILFYENGESYYNVWVNHFGEDGTPWDEAVTEGTPAEGNIYPGGAPNYLGRWGMLRNNWYDINVTGIKSVGDPIVAEVTGETIDKKESYCSVEINILSWAKRTQDAEL